MVKAHLILSEPARQSLAVAGVSAQWLVMWLRSAGASSVSVQNVSAVKNNLEGWKLIIADVPDLLRIAVQHGRRVGVKKDDEMTVLGAKLVQLSNPERHAWSYECFGKTLLIPIGDVLMHRQRWLNVFCDGQALKPLWIMAGEPEQCQGIESMVLEPGLLGALDQPDDSMQRLVFNDGGYLPEEQVLRCLHRHGYCLRTVESCTAGGVAARIGRIPGASNILDCSWVTYSNESKTRLVHVEEGLIENHGAVSKQVVEAMAIGALQEVTVPTVTIAISGIAGPGCSEDKPQGLVWFAIATNTNTVTSMQQQFFGSRTSVQAQAVIVALLMLCRAMA